ncbi:PREDICTED: uncharacterized protein LOC104603285 isoform X1 [Nelumbo nucifera]|uniref:Uncharacterized protein LOC104603285 isoform X1 n=1 Tax=Nelumbo nucifera TaxID=4432 RepID=A0A1U8ADJ8_NELNU|nr:PREDICTED: uncharacterized protein LOC104603285 isoform X1 [Nelumbo nucifera]
MSVSLSVMTFNLHGDQLEDSPNSWEKRRDLCISVITSYSPMILCTQQGLKSQLEFLQQGLPGYGQFGISRKGSHDPSDEHCTIFYDKEKVDLLEGGTFWLSESPSVPGSTSWGSAVPCIATWVTFQLKGVEPPGFSFQIVNTNMDEFSSRARRRSALLTWQHIASLPPTLPVVYCGGFNTQKESTTGRFLLGTSRCKCKHLDSNVVYVGNDDCCHLFSLLDCREHGVVGDMRDAWPNARVRKNASLIRTFHGFKGDKQGTLEFLKLILRALCLCWDRQTQDLHVDWVLYRGRSLIPVSCEVVNDNIDGFYPSSHYPIFAEFMLPRNVRLLGVPAQERS